MPDPDATSGNIGAYCLGVTLGELYLYPSFFGFLSLGYSGTFSTKCTYTMMIGGVIMIGC